MRHSPTFANRSRLVLAIAVVFLGALAGCRSVRGTADRGQRIVEQPVMNPSKVAASIGAIPGYAVGMPLSILLLPTLPFSSLTYHSSPEKDIPMPILFAPLDIGSGLGAYAFAAPFTLFRPELGTVDQPTEWPPAREWKSTEKRPGQIVEVER
jgi:hypothetical protein